MAKSSPSGFLDVDFEEIEALPVDDETDEALISLDGRKIDISDDELREHFENLAENMSEDELSSIATDLMEGVNADFESMGGWLKVCGRAVREMGLDRDEDQGSVPFNGASGAIHPALSKACVDFSSRAIGEMCPANGPVRTKIIGQYTPEKQAQSEAIREYMNYQLTAEIPEYRDSRASLLTMLPALGSYFSKVFWNDMEGRIDFCSIMPGDLIVNMRAPSLDRAPRVTHRLELSYEELVRQQRAGIYRDIDVGSNDMDVAGTNHLSQLQEAIDNIIGESDGNFLNLTEGYLSLLEIRCHLDLASHQDVDDEGEPTGRALPYVVTIHPESGKVLSIYRNWEEDDARKKALMPIFHYKFIAWQGFFGLGLFHLIGGIQSSLTGALRALLDAAQIQNMGGGIRLKGVRFSGETAAYNPLEWTEVECDFGEAQPDLARYFMQFPRAEPSNMLYQLLGSMSEEAASFAGIATQQVADANNNGPVGTTLALIEQGSKIYSSIHAGLHATQARELQEMARLNGIYLDDEKTVATHDGELVIRRADFSSAIDVLPVSDPNIYSDAQRYAQLQAVFQLAQQQPALYNMEALNNEALHILRIPQPERFLAQRQNAIPLDPVSEVWAIVDGKPVDAFAGQDHAAHVAYLLAIGNDPQYQPLVQAHGPQLQALVGRHLAMQAADEAMTAYQQLSQQAQMAGQPLPPPDPRMIAQIQSQAAQSQSQQRQAIQAQQAQQQGGGDLAAQAMMVEAQASMKDVERKAAEDVAKAEQAARKAQLDLEELQAKHQRELLALQQKSQVEAAKIDADLVYKMNEANEQRVFDAEQAAMDREVKLQIAAMSASKSASVEGPIGSVADGDPADGIMARTVAWLKSALGR